MPALQRKYCGTSAVLPPGYTDFDDRYSCLRKGFGVAKGKYGEARQCRTNYRAFVIAIITLAVVVLLLIAGMIATIVLFHKHKPIEQDDEREDEGRSR